MHVFSYHQHLRLHIGILSAINFSCIVEEELVIFTDEEWTLFEKRIDEGYDLPPRGRYLQWLKIHHAHLTGK